MAEAREKKKPGRVREWDERLDEALRQTFPASDPVAVGEATATEPPSRPVDRKAPKINRDELAVRGRRRAPS